MTGSVHLGPFGLWDIKSKMNRTEAIRTQKTTVYLGRLRGMFLLEKEKKVAEKIKIANTQNTQVIKKKTIVHSFPI